MLALMILFLLVSYFVCALVVTLDCWAGLTRLVVELGRRLDK